MNFPFVNDKFHKLAFCAGIGLIISQYLFTLDKIEEREKQRIAFNVGLDRYNIENEKLVVDSIPNLIRKNELASVQVDLRAKRREIEYLDENIKEYSKISDFLIYIASFLVVIGGGIWTYTDFIDFKTLKVNNEILIRQNLDKPTYSLNCQSCGRKFNSMNRYGTEADNSKNYHFCQNCYTNGLFIYPNQTLEEMKINISEELAKKGKSKSFIKNEIECIGRLERWNY